MSHIPGELSRRELLEQAAMAAGVTAALAAIPRSARASDRIVLPDGQPVLFQGNSITDAGRDRRREQYANDPRGMGDGYAMLVGCELLRDYPEKQLKVYNRGISGNKVPDLDHRWQEDCLALQPSLLSILIGVNDMWHRLSGRFDGTVADYEAGLSALLGRTRAGLPGTVIVICEPFVLRCGAVDEKWFPEFNERRTVARQLSDDTKAIWVPFQTMFDEAVAAGIEPAYWAGDGVHPSMAGHALMARTWRQVVGI